MGAATELPAGKVANLESSRLCRREMVARGRKVASLLSPFRSSVRLVATPRFGFYRVHRHGAHEVMWLLSTFALSEAPAPTSRVAMRSATLSDRFQR